MVVNKNLEKIINKYNEQQLAHAFLLETNDYHKCLRDVLEVVKNIMCQNEYKEACENNCNICHLIEQGNLPSFQTVETKDANIKKSQIIDLKKQFQAKSIYSDYNIYIIKEAEKLTKASANTMLKFLEEPDGQVVGFFITNNQEKILETIRSRCLQMKIHYTYGNVNEELQLDEDTYKRYLEIIEEYVKILESDSVSLIFQNKNLILDNFKERTEITSFFNILLAIYESVLDKVLQNKELPKEFEIFTYITKNKTKKIIEKLNIINEVLANLAYNPNLELLLDKFVIEMGNIV